MYKSVFLILLLINGYDAFSTIGNINILKLRNTNSNVNLERRDVLKIARFITLPYIFNNYPKFSNADDNSKSIDDLREEAYRIIEIIDAQKDTLNLPTLGETIKEIKKPINEDNLATKKEAKNISEK